MKSAHPMLPLNYRDGDRRPGRVEFQEEEHLLPVRMWNRLGEALVEFIRRVTTVSTGSPSDGMGGGSGSMASSKSSYTLRQKAVLIDPDDENGEVDHVVVQGEDPYAGRKSDRSTSSPAPSINGNSVHPALSSTSKIRAGLFGLAHVQRWQDWVREFFDPQMSSYELEIEYQKQAWYTNKKWSFYGAIYLVINWVLYLILNRTNTNPVLFNEIAYYGVLTLFTVPLPFLVGADIPMKYPRVFHLWFTIAVWWCGVSEIIYMKNCGFFLPGGRTNCSGKDFLAMMYYITAQPALLMFVLGHRIYNFVAQIITLGLLLWLIIPEQSIFTRNVIAFLLFSLFLQGLHYSRETMDRRLFLLHDRLKTAYKSQQKAQVAESKASLAKRRFASYIFHEVRVPLNTAMLAYQNLQAANVFKDAQMQYHDTEVYALEVSLTMMQQVLNDALDFTKMDAGHFESNPRPFPLHHVIKSALGPFELAAATKHASLNAELDSRIDAVAMSTTPIFSGEGLWVLGDEVRLRQVLTNLVSNAVKFSPDGSGKVEVTTKLLSSYTDGAGGDAGDDDPDTPPSLDSVTFRLEVKDNGPGISRRDIRENRLFQPFAQTDVGRVHGKGTGLGLAIVRQIVVLSHGSLGVNSRKGEGSTFWIEMTYPIAKYSDIQAVRNGTIPVLNLPVSLTSPPLRLKGDEFPFFRQQSRGGILRSSPSDPMDIELATPSTPSAPTVLDTPSLEFSSLLPRRPPGIQTPMPTPSDIESEDPVKMIPHGETASVVFSPPLERLPEAKTQPKSPPPAKPPTNLQAESSTSSDNAPLNVLVVDDDQLTRSLMQRMLLKLGCKVDLACDGQQCLDMVLGHPERTYDLICLDNYMPVMTGEEAVKQLRAVGRQELVIGCTGNALTDDQNSYLIAGADRILTKPISRDDIQALLQAARQRRQTTLENEESQS